MPSDTGDGENLLLVAITSLGESLPVVLLLAQLYERIKNHLKGFRPKISRGSLKTKFSILLKERNLKFCNLKIIKLNLI